MLVVLALREGARRETFRLLLESERSDCSVKLCGDGRTALLDTRALTPQVLALDQVLPLLDGPAVLAALEGACLPCPPKVILLSAPGQEAPCPAPPGVDEYLPAHAEFEEFLYALQRAEDKLQGSLAVLSGSRRRTLIEALFMELGMPKSLKGRAYLSFLLDLVVPSPDLLDALTTRLYPAAAQRFSTSPAAVERCIRHAIESTWSRGDMAALEKLFGLSIDPDRGKPTNREFVAMVSQHLRQRAVLQEENPERLFITI
jgi:two-component system response regulator (stage 0 sporulation protein A)